MVDPGAADGDLARLRAEHRERLKELAALHDMARLLRDPALSVEALLTRVAVRLPAAMLHVDDAAARVAYGAIEARTPGFAATAWVLRRTFRTTDGTVGVIEVAYGTAHREETEGPFLAEECTLLDSIADILNAELERRVVGLAVQERDAMLALAAATANLGVWQWSIEEDAVTWSPELVRMVGHDLTGAALGTSAIYAEDRLRVVKTVQDAVTDPDRVLELEFRAVRADGQVIWIGARGRVLRGMDGRPTRVLGILADITRRKALEDGILHLQRMEAMGQIAAGVAHDFNNVLAVMRLSAAEMLDALAAGDPCRSIVTEINDALARGVGLTRQLLSFSRKSPIKPIVLDPIAAIRRAEPMLKRLVGERARLVLDLDATPAVVADATQLDQVVMNLVVNARDAITDSGTITVATRVVEIDAAPYVVISVADTGSGMTPEIKARLFEPCFTTKPVGQGTGLGLAVVRGVVEQSKGFVTVNSEPGRGARFDVHFPPALTSR